MEGAETAKSCSFDSAWSRLQLDVELDSLGLENVDLEGRGLRDTTVPEFSMGTDRGTESSAFSSCCSVCMYSLISVFFQVALPTATAVFSTVMAPCASFCLLFSDPPSLCIVHNLSIIDVISETLPIDATRLRISSSLLIEFSLSSAWRSLAIFRTVQSFSVIPGMMMSSIVSSGMSLNTTLYLQPVGDTPIGTTAFDSPWKRMSSLAAMPRSSFETHVIFGDDAAQRW